MTVNQVKLHRVIKAEPEKVYRAFSSPEAYANWIPPYGFLCTIHSMDFKKGGKFKMSFTNFTTGNSHSFGGTFDEIVPNEFLQYSDQFDDPNLPGTLITKVWIKKVICGTEITVTQEGIPEAIPLEMCYLGWQDSLKKLQDLVEPNIPND